MPECVFKYIYCRSSVNKPSLGVLGALINPQSTIILNNKINS